MMEIPALIVEPDGTSGLTIKAKMGKKYNCVEFTLRDDVPVPILISPWIQFPSAEWQSDRLELANEIVRRANAYAGLVQQITSLQGQLESWMDCVDERNEDINALVDQLRSLLTFEENTPNAKLYAKYDKGTDVSHLMKELPSTTKARNRK